MALDFPVFAEFPGANETELFSIEVYLKYIKHTEQKHIQFIYLK